MNTQHEKCDPPQSSTTKHLLLVAEHQSATPTPDICACVRGKGSTAVSEGQQSLQVV